MQTHRANLSADTVITCWVRDESGKRDLSAKTLTVTIGPYGFPCVLLTLDATSPATGKVTFTVTQAAADAYFCPGVYRFSVIGTQSSVDENVYSGLLEVV
jgi:hypothetical protein